MKIFRRTRRIQRLVATTAFLSLVLLASAGCGRGPGRDAGVADPAVAQGFPVFANTVLVSTMTVVEESILEQERIIGSLAGLPEVQSADWSRMKEIVGRFQASMKDSGVYWFALPDGRYYTVGQGLVGRTLSDRPYFPLVMTGRPAVGDLVVSRSTGRKSAVVVLPVRGAGGRVVGCLGASIFLDKLAGRLSASLSLPDGCFFYALAPDGMTAVHLKQELVFDNPLSKDSPSMRTAVEKMLATDSGEVEYTFNGFHRRVRYQVSGLTGWRFAFGINTSTADSGPKTGR